MLSSQGVQQSQASCLADIGICGFLSKCPKAVTHAIMFPEYSLEGLMLKLKLQHFGHLM